MACALRRHGHPHAEEAARWWPTQRTCDGSAAMMERRREGGKIGEREVGKFTLVHVGKPTISSSPTNTF